jgi:alpha-amylase
VDRGEQNPTAAEQQYILCRPPHRDLCWDDADISYDGMRRTIVRLDMLSPQMLEYQKRILAFWLDPNHDGELSDGVDGFRVDHVANLLDDVQDGLLANVWKPIIESARKVNPRAFFLGEQSGWDGEGDHHGRDLLTDGGFDAVFSFPLRTALLTFDPALIHAEVDGTFGARHPADKHVFVMVENHDLPRLQTMANTSSGLSRVLGVVALLLPGIPELYYGQEIGMRGQKQDWRVIANGTVGSDGNDIATREAFKWTKDPTAPGMPIWYAHTGPWWTQTSLYDTVSLEEQVTDPGSLWNTYRAVIRLRRSSLAATRGTYAPISVADPDILAFERSYEGADAQERLVVVANLSPERRHATVNVAGPWTLAFSLATTTNAAGAIDVSLGPFGIAVFEPTR